MDSPYAQKPWSDRSSILGDVAETAFRKWAGERKIIRLGLDHADFPQSGLQQLPKWVRHSPDFVLYDGWSYFVEVIGTVSDSFKIRKTKVDGLEPWVKSGVPILLFIWNSETAEYALIPFRELSFGEVEHFASDGNAYYTVPVYAWRPIGV